MTSINHDAWIPRDGMAVLANCSTDTRRREWLSPSGRPR